MNSYSEDDSKYTAIGSKLLWTPPPEMTDEDIMNAFLTTITTQPTEEDQNENTSKKTTS